MLSDRGLVRRGNEDSCGAMAQTGIFVVCDGMGGAAGGEVASHLAAEIFLSHLSHSSTPNGSGPIPTAARIQNAIEAANRAIFQQARRTPQLSGMGTTLVGLLHDLSHEDESSSSTLWLVHVGDSRCYLWYESRLERLTDDHSLVEEQVRAGQITQQQAEESPMRNLITRAVGSHSSVEPEIQARIPHPGEIYLLASDGLTNELSESEISDILASVPPHPTQAHLYGACRSLVQAANRKGGNDNITVLLVAPDVSASEETP
jgi:PPM family protein phosphatase